MTELERLIEVLTQMEGSSFDLVDEEWIRESETEFPGIPADLKELYRALGSGRIGKSRYMVHFLTEPEEIFDEITAEELQGVLIVGDDYSGNCEAYDTKNQWTFGSIGSDGQFEPYGDEIPNLVGFLTKWFVAEESA